MNKAQTEIKKMWRIIATGSSSVLELRALWPTGIAPSKPPLTKHFRAKDHSTVVNCKAAFEAEALRLNSLGYNIYIVMNPISESFQGKSVVDADISHRELLLIDIDRAEKMVAPATESEIDAARQVADAIAAFMQERGWSDPFRVMSGNGHHIYYTVADMPNNDESKHLIQITLLNLAQHFDNDLVKIDTVVFNASRITKVLGTIARKGVESEDRPYRMAVLHEA
jgi:hypothetical protein